MKFKRLFTFFAGTCLAVLITEAMVFASTNVTLSQAQINGKNIDLYLSTELDESTLSVKVANQLAEVFDSGIISNEEVTIRSTVLVDVSTSVPYAARDKVLEFIGYKIENIAKNEEMKIVTFGDQIKVLQDFTSDRYDLEKSVENIAYTGQESAIYDAIYNTIPKIESGNEEACFYRTIVITDGVDYSAQGITKEELYMRLQAETYPVDVVCVSSEKTDVSNKDLSALSRISSGRYFDVNPESDAFQLVSNMSVSGYFWIRAEVPAQLLDGSTRQVDILDANNSISFDMKMSVVDVPPTENQFSEQSNSPSTGENSVSSSSSTASDQVSVSASSDEIDEQNLNFNTSMLLIIIAGIAVVAVVILMVAVTVVKKKDNMSNRSEHQIKTSQNNSAVEKTEFLGEMESGNRYVIKISNISNPSENWILDVNDEIIIGRADSCAVKFTEKSVSREQCKISIGGSGLVIMNLSGSNTTKLNGVNIISEMLLHPADTIRFGRITLRVDYIQKLGEDPIAAQALADSMGNADSTPSGNTQSIF